MDRCYSVARVLWDLLVRAPTEGRLIIQSFLALTSCDLLVGYGSSDACAEVLRAQVCRSGNLY